MAAAGSRRAWRRRAEAAGRRMRVGELEASLAQASGSSGPADAGGRVPDDAVIVAPPRRIEEGPGPRPRPFWMHLPTSWRERWTGAYDALVDAAAAAVREPGCTVALTDLHRCLDAFSESCDRAEGLVQAAAASRHDELCRAVRAVDKDLRAAAAGREENEMEEDKNRPPITPLAAEDK